MPDIARERAAVSPGAASLSKISCLLLRVIMWSATEKSVIQALQLSSSGAAQAKDTMNSVEGGARPAGDRSPRDLEASVQCKKSPMHRLSRRHKKRAMLMIGHTRRLQHTALPHARGSHRAAKRALFFYFSLFSSAPRRWCANVRVRWKDHCREHGRSSISLREKERAADEVLCKREGGKQGEDRPMTLDNYVNNCLISYII